VEGLLKKNERTTSNKLKDERRTSNIQCWMKYKNKDRSFR